MKSLYKFVCQVILSLILGILFLYHANSYGYLPGPDGSTITHIAVFNESGVDYKLITTEHSVYSSFFSSDSGWSKAYKLWSFPMEGSSISEITLKNNESATIRHFYVLLTDGTVYGFTYHTQKNYFTDTAMIEKPLSYFSKYSIRNLNVYSNYYLISNSIIYVNKLDGAGWKPDSLGGYSTVFSICLDKNNNLLAASNMGLYRQAPDLSDFVRLGVDEYPPGFFIVYCTQKGKVYTISNEGHLYRLSETGDTLLTDYDYLKLSSMKLADDKQGNLYASGFTYQDYGLFRKKPTDTWERIDTNITNSTGYIANFNDISGLNTLEAGATEGSYTSTDGGETWQLMNKGIESENFSAGFVLNNETMITRTNSGLFAQTLPYANHWYEIYPGSKLSGPDMIYRDKNDNIFISGYRGNYTPLISKSTNNGLSWDTDTVGVSVLPKSRGFVFIDKNGGQHITYSTNNDGTHLILYSKTSATPWTIDTLGLNNTDGSMSDLNFYGNGSDDNYIYVSGYYRLNNNNYYEYFVYKRKYDESKWTSDTAGLNKRYLSGFISVKNGTLYCIASKSSGGNRIVKYEAGRWNDINNLPVSEFCTINAIGFDSTNTLYSAFDISGSKIYNESVYATSDDGKTWLSGDMGRNIPLTFAANKKDVFAFTKNRIMYIKTSPAIFPKLSVIPDSIDFGQVRTGKEKDTTIKISNIGNDTLIFIRFTPPRLFTTIDSILIIAPGESKSLTFTFSPTTVGPTSMTMRFGGNVFTRNMLLKGEGILTDSSAKYKLSRDTIDFGLVQSGKYKDTAVVFYNTGLDTLHVYDVETHATYFSSFHYTFNVPPGGKFIDTIRFRPQDAGLIQGFLVVYSNLLPDTIFVKGTDGKKPKPKLKLADSLLDFGAVPTGKSKYLSTFVVNYANEIIVVKEFRSSSDCFTVDHKSDSLYPYSGSSIYVTFSPKKEQQYNEFIEIIANDLPDTLFLTGFGSPGTAVEENTLIERPFISPNPATDFLEISVGANGVRPEQNIEILSILGETVLTVRAKGTSPLQIDLSRLPQGIYFVKVGDKVGKFVKI